MGEQVQASQYKSQMSDEELLAAAETWFRENADGASRAGAQELIDMARVMQRKLARVENFLEVMSVYAVSEKKRDVARVALKMIHDT